MNVNTFFFIEMRELLSTILIVLWTWLQLFTPSFGHRYKIKKECKIEEEVVKFRENFAFSGQLVREVTTQITYQHCSEDEPNCCGKTGCCDERKWKLIVIMIVAVVASLLLLTFTFVCFYSVCCNRKKHKGEEPVLELPVHAEPRYTMKTYLAVAGFDPESIPVDGPPRSSVRSTVLEEDSSSDSFDDD